MAIKQILDPDYDQCFESDCEIDCEPYKGCMVSVTLGPCSALQDGILDLTQHCQPRQLTAISLNPNQEILTKQYYGSCYERTKKGNFTYTIDLTIELCEEDEFMCRLLNYGCLVSWCIMPRGFLYNPNLPSDQQQGILYGKARVGSGAWEFPFSDLQNISTTLTGEGRIWRYGFCPQNDGVLTNNNTVLDEVPQAANVPVSQGKIKKQNAEAA